MPPQLKRLASVVTTFLDETCPWMSPESRKNGHASDARLSCNLLFPQCPMHHDAKDLGLVRRSKWECGNMCFSDPWTKTNWSVFLYVGDRLPNLKIYTFHKTVEHWGIILLWSTTKQIQHTGRVSIPKSLFPQRQGWDNSTKKGMVKTLWWKKLARSVWWTVKLTKLCVISSQVRSAFELRDVIRIHYF